MWSFLVLQKVHHLTQPIIDSLVAFFQRVHVDGWSLLKEFFEGFEFFMGDDEIFD